MGLPKRPNCISRHLHASSALAGYSSTQREKEATVLKTFPCSGYGPMKSMFKRSFGLHVDVEYFYAAMNRDIFGQPRMYVFVSRHFLFQVRFEFFKF